MQDDAIARVGDAPVRDGVIFAGGYGVRISVDRRHLVISQGTGRDRKVTRLAKAVSRVKRVVIRAATGAITFEALRWLHDANAGLIQVGFDGSIHAEPARRLDDARLRRAQAVAFDTPLRSKISRRLLQQKVAGQITVLQTFDLGETAALDEALARLSGDGSLTEGLNDERLAAEFYWGLWEKVRIQFARRDTVPDHWLTFGRRSSVLTNSPRKATNPAGACLNYLYAIAEAETCLALIARGLDAGLGFFHLDSPNRDSLALDVLESIRPHVDAFLLNLISSRVFSARDFVEIGDGTCRLGNALAHELAETSPRWGRLVERQAEMVARTIISFAKYGTTRELKLVPRTLQHGRMKVRTRPLDDALTPSRVKIPVTRVKNACRNCGMELRIRKRVYCNTCLPGELKRIQESTKIAFNLAGRSRLAHLRKAGADPSRTPEATLRRRQAASRQRQRSIAWHDDGQLSNIDFRRDVLPNLAEVSVTRIAEAMNASKTYCSKVRNGHVVPHRRHWCALIALARRPPSG